MQENLNDDNASTIVIYIIIKEQLKSWQIWIGSINNGEKL